MMKNRTLTVVLTSAALLSLMFVSTINPHLTYAQNEKFKAKLKGENEVPPVTSAATGKAKFKVKDDAITSKINITAITDVTAAHIHAGITGQNGEPVVDLLKTASQNKTAGGVIIQGEITSTDLQGSMVGKTLQDLQTAMSNEETYVNIHTSEHPNGEIRGQIKVSGGNATEAESMDASSTPGTEEE